MADVNAALLGSLAEGMPLPARRDEIVEYAEIEGADEDILDALRALPDREYESLDDIEEAVRPVQPNAPAEGPGAPRAESGEAPGRERYTA